MVSGVSRGLGRALVEVLVARDWEVIGLSRGEVTTPVGASVLTCDVTDPDVAPQIEEALSGRSLDLLIHNAGVYEGSHRIEDFDPEDLAQSIDVHAIAAATLLNAALPALYRAERPRVVNVSSRLASLARAADGTYAHLHQSLAYRVGKAALNMLTLVAAESLRDTPIELSAVHPGRLRTAMGARDADMSPQEGAERLITWIESDSPHHKVFYDIEEGAIIPW